jgi:hypothetical protein
MYEIIIKRMYGLIFSILIFTDIINFVKSIIIAYPVGGTYCVIFLIGLLYEIPFTSDLFKLNCEPRLIYKNRVKSTLIGLITFYLYYNYKQQVLYKDITLLMNFNNQYFDSLLFDNEITKDCELKFEDLLKFYGLQTLCFYNLFYYVDHPHVFSVILYNCLPRVITLNVVYYYYFDIYIDEIKKKFNANDLIKFELIKRNHLKALKLILYLVWDMEYYLDNTFNPIEQKSLRLDIVDMERLMPDYYEIEFYNYKKFEKLSDILPFIFKRKGNEIEFFNLDLNFAFYEKIYNIVNFYRFSDKKFYNNKTFETKFNLYNKVFIELNDSFQYTIKRYI